MYDRIRSAGASAGKVDAVVVALPKGDRLPRGAGDLPAPVADAIAAARKRPDFDLSRGAVHALYPADGPRVFVVGLGDADKFDSQSVRVGASALVGRLHAAKVKRAQMHLGAASAGSGGASGRIDASTAAAAFADGLLIGSFTFDAFKGTVTRPARDKAQPATLDVVLDASQRAAFDRAATVGESANLARTLAATPPNVANPSYLVSQCRTLAKKVGLKCTIVDEKRAVQLKMGGLLAVGRAGSTPPALICLEWPGARAGKSRSSKSSRAAAPVMLVGKAVTFDTGGYSIKPSDSMVTMKYDKCGGMAVIGAMHAIAKLKLPIPVVGVVPAAENMIDDDAYRPSDIVTICNGVTVEITNTDAEGRMILADALAYGCKTYKPRAVIDLATLTGGVVTALGPYCAGAFCEDAALHKTLFDAAEDTGERLWRLPLWDEHREQMKGTHSDLVNSAGRFAHPIQGAAFLSYFVARDGDFAKNEPVPWAHLDIAGVADTKDARPPYGKGPTGFGVRLLVRALETWK